MKIVRNQEGQQVKVLNDDVCIKLASSESRRQMSVVTVDLPAGGFVPPHTHAEEEEGYYVLRGEMKMHLGDEVVGLHEGDFVHVPEKTVHGYRNDSSEPCRFLAWTVGGPIDRFFVEMSEQVKALPQDLSRMPALLAKYAIHMKEPS